MAGHDDVKFKWGNKKQDWKQLTCNMSAPPKYSITSGYESSKSNEVGFSSSVTAEVGVEADLGAAKLTAKTAYSVGMSLAHSWSNTSSKEETIEMECEFD